MGLRALLQDWHDGLVLPNDTLAVRLRKTLVIVFGLAAPVIFIGMICVAAAKPDYLGLIIAAAVVSLLFPIPLIYLVRTKEAPRMLVAATVWTASFVSVIVLPVAFPKLGLEAVVTGFAILLILADAGHPVATGVVFSAQFIWLTLAQFFAPSLVVLRTTFAGTEPANREAIFVLSLVIYTFVNITVLFVIRRTLDEVNRLTYLLAVCSESLRLLLSVNVDGVTSILRYGRWDESDDALSSSLFSSISLLNDTLRVHKNHIPDDMLSRAALEESRQQTAVRLAAQAAEEAGEAAAAILRLSASGSTNPNRSSIIGNNNSLSHDMDNLDPRSPGVNNRSADRVAGARTVKFAPEVRANDDDHEGDDEDGGGTGGANNQRDSSTSDERSDVPTSSGDGSGQQPPAGGYRGGANNNNLSASSSSTRRALPPRLDVAVRPVSFAHITFLFTEGYRPTADLVELLNQLVHNSAQSTDGDVAPILFTDSYVVSWNTRPNVDIPGCSAKACAFALQVKQNILEGLLRDDRLAGADGGGTASSLLGVTISVVSGDAKCYFPKTVAAGIELNNFSTTSSSSVPSATGSGGNASGNNHNAMSFFLAHHLSDLLDSVHNTALGFYAEHVAKGATPCVIPLLDEITQAAAQAEFSCRGIASFLPTATFDGVKTGIPMAAYELMGNRAAMSPSEEAMHDDLSRAVRAAISGDSNRATAVIEHLEAKYPSMVAGDVMVAALKASVAKQRGGQRK